MNAAVPGKVSTVATINDGLANMLAAGVMTIYFSTSGTVYTPDYGNDACFSNTINELTAASYPVADVTISAAVSCMDGDTANFSVTGTPFEFVTGYT